MNAGRAGIGSRVQGRCRTAAPRPRKPRRAAGRPRYNRHTPIPPRLTNPLTLATSRFLIHCGPSITYVDRNRTGALAVGERRVGDLSPFSLGFAAHVLGAANGFFEATEIG